MNVIYCDHNATTPLDPEVHEAMQPWLEGQFGNASSIHRFGRDARYAVEKARQEVARLIGVSDDEIVFTSGGTESDNLALLGTARALHDKGRHIITSALEHPAVLGACEILEEDGYEVTRLLPDEYGIISPEQLTQAIRKDTLLVSIIAANNETGVIQNISDLAEVTHKVGVIFHTDAVQAAGRIPVDVEKWRADLLSLSAHKMNGPKGAGALYVRSGINLYPLMRGGHQERGLRPGTENVAAIAGFGMAARLARIRLHEDMARIAALRDRLEQRILESIPDVLVAGGGADRIPGTLNLCFAGLKGTWLVMKLDERGIAVSTGSACSAGDTRPSHVLKAMGISETHLMGGLRLSLGRTNTAEEMDRVFDALRETVHDLRAHPPRNNGS